MAANPPRMTMEEYVDEIVRLTDGRPDDCNYRVALVVYGVEGLRLLTERAAKARRLEEEPDGG